MCAVDLCTSIRMMVALLWLRSFDFDSSGISFLRFIGAIFRYSNNVIVMLLPGFYCLYTYLTIQ